MPLPLNRYTPAGITANAQLEYEQWVAQMRAEQARQEAEIQLAEEQARIAEEEARRQEAAVQQAQQAQQPAAPGARGEGFTDPRLIGSATEGEQAARQTARGPAATPQPTAFDKFLAEQTVHPVVRTRAQFDAAPRHIQESLFSAGWPVVVRTMGWSPGESVRQRKAAATALITAPPDTSFSLDGQMDLVRSFGSGVAGLVKSMAAAFGSDNALARVAADYERLFAEGKSEGSRRNTAWLSTQLDAARKAGRTDMEIMAWLRDGLGQSPGETMANLAGSLTALLAAPVAIAAAPVAGAATVAAGTAVTLGAVSGFGAVKREAFESAEAELRKQGVAPDEARRRAEQIAGSGTVTAVAATNAAVSALGGRLGLEKALLPLARKSASAVGARSVIGSGLGEALTEVPNSLIENTAGNIGNRAAGGDAPLTQGAGLAATQGFVLGNAAGWGGGLLAQIRNRGAQGAATQSVPAAGQPAPAPAAGVPTQAPVAAPGPVAPAPAGAGGPAAVPAVPGPAPTGPAAAPAVATAGPVGPAAPTPAGPAGPTAAAGPAGPAPAAPTGPAAAAPAGVGADVVLAKGKYTTVISPPAAVNSTGDLLDLLKETGQEAQVDPVKLRATLDQLSKTGGLLRTEIEQGLGITLGPRTVSLGRDDLGESAATTILTDLKSRGVVPKHIETQLRRGSPIKASKVALDLAAEPNISVFEAGMFTWLSSRLGDDVIRAGRLSINRRGVMGTYGRAAADTQGPGEITISPSKGMNTWVIMHEMLHGATVRMLDPGVQLDEAQTAARSTIEALYAHYGSLEISSGIGGVINNVKEFVAEGLGNHMVRGVLKATKLPGDIAGTTMWDKFRNSLRALVGLPTSVAPDNMLDALLDAVDTLSPTRAATGRAVLESDVAKMEITDGLTTVRGTVSDSVFVRASSDTSGTTRGSATLDPDIGVYHAVWHKDDGTVVRSGPIGAQLDKYGKPLPLPQQVALKRWFDDRDPEGRPVYTMDQRRSDQQLNIQKMINELDTLAPSSRRVFAAMQRAVRTIPLADRVFTPDMLLGATRALAGLYQWGGNRYLPTDAIRDGAARYAKEMAGQLQVERGLSATEARSAVEQVLAGVGADAVMRRSAQATAERTNVGATGDKSWAQHKGDLLHTHAELRALGVPADIVNDYAYAVSAIQANAIRAQEFPTDAMGYATSPDKSKFSFYTDSAGRIIPLGDGADAPPGATLHSGVSAPHVFRTLFEQQFPKAAAKAKDMMEVVAAGNLRTLQIQLANGAITTTEFLKLRQQQYYLPMQQPKEKLKSRGGAATGRRTRAENPLAQWLAVNDARIDHAAWAGSVRDIARALRMAPNPSIAAIGAHTRKLKPAEAPTNGNAPASMVEMVRLDFTGDATVIFREGDDIYEMTIVDPALLRALKAPTLGGPIDRAVGAARTLTHFQAFTRTAANLSFLLAQIPIDVMTGIANAQGAWRSAADGGMVLTPAQARTVAAKILPGMVVNLGSAIKNTYNPLHTTRSPMRRLYDSHGGGVHMDARIGFTAGVDMLGGTTNSLTGGAGSLARRGAGAIEHGVQGLGHVWSDAIRFTGFKAYLELMNGGPFKTEAALQAFVRDNPNRLAEAVTGSKNLLGNFERTGSTVIARAVLPFFNASVVGTTQVMPQVLASSHGWQTVALMTAAVFFTALAKMQEEDDRDHDGTSKFLSGSSAWKDLVIGGVKIPLMPEFRPFIAGAVLAAAAVADAKLPKDDGFFTERVLHSMLEMLPAKVPDFDDASLMHAVGIVGVPLMLSAGIDQYGKRVARDGNSIDASAPEWTQVRNGDSELAADTAEALSKLGLDIAPGTISTIVGQFTGAMASMASEMNKGTVDGRGALGAAIDWTAKRFVYDAQRESQFGTSERLMHAERELLAERDPDLLLGNREAINQQRRAITGVRTSEGLTVAQAIARQAQARRSGDADAYQRLEADIRVAAEQQSMLRATAIEMLKARVQP